MEEGKLVTTETGTPQGAVASPLLANIYLQIMLVAGDEQVNGEHGQLKESYRISYSVPAFAEVIATMHDNTRHDVCSCTPQENRLGLVRITPVG